MGVGYSNSSMVESWTCFLFPAEFSQFISYLTHILRKNKSNKRLDRRGKWDVILVAQAQLKAEACTYPPKKYKKKEEKCIAEQLKRC